MLIVTSFVLLFTGLFTLVVAADVFVESSAAVARRFNISEMVIGLTLVAFGTSAPELATSLYAAAVGSSGIAVGTVVGSNITNVAILGICAAIVPLATDENVVRDGLVVLSISLLLAVLAFQGISRWEGCVLIVAFVSYMAALRMRGGVTMQDENIRFSGVLEFLKLCLGGFGIFLGAKLMVDSAVSIAAFFNILESVIGSTLIAFGTSAPELAVSVNAAVKRHGGISVGNILGSNIFNAALIVGLSSLVRPLGIDDALFFWNIPMMLFTAALLLIFIRTKHELSRLEGIVLIATYVVFLCVNYMLF
ncbi:MAG TPA: calcium/sodium antiporter [Methanomicrobia archaeon]|nr:calcium/sodium antiporter [Methanomicrobia archaeon]HEX59929.1 calcium/sodium antiporter [Methanomicrobia archaeon]